MDNNIAIVAWCTTESDKQIARQLIKESGTNTCSLLLTRSGNKYRLSEYQRMLKAPPNEFKSIQAAWEWIRNHYPEKHVFIESKLNNADLPQDTVTNFLIKCSTLEIKKDLVSNFINHTDAYFSYSPLGHSAAEIHDDFIFAGPDAQEICYYIQKDNSKTLPAPKMISLDLSPQCTKRCAKCHFHAYNSPFSRYIPKKEKMSLQLAKRLMQEAAQFDPKPTIAPTFSGEPLLYPHLIDLIHEANQLGLPFSITTNAMLLNKNLAQQLVDLEVGTIMISLDASDPDTYKKLQSPGELKNVKENIRYLIKIRKGQRPQIGLTYVVEEQNKTEFSDFLSEWSDVDYIVKSHKLNTVSGRAKSELPLYASHPEEVACVASLQSLYIRYDGRVALCGYDVKSQIVPLKAGSELTLKQIWQSNDMNALRKKMINPPHNYGYCSKGACRCGQYLWDTAEEGYKVTVSPITKIYRVQ